MFELWMICFVLQIYPIPWIYYSCLHFIFRHSIHFIVIRKYVDEQLHKSFHFTNFNGFDSKYFLVVSKEQATSKLHISMDAWKNVIIIIQTNNKAKDFCASVSVNVRAFIGLLTAFYEETVFFSFSESFQRKLSSQLARNSFVRFYSQQCLEYPNTRLPSTAWFSICIVFSSLIDSFCTMFRQFSFCFICHHFYLINVRCICFIPLPIQSISNVICHSMAMLSKNDIKRDKMSASDFVWFCLYVCFIWCALNVYISTEVRVCALRQSECSFELFTCCCCCFCCWCFSDFIFRCYCYQRCKIYSRQRAFSLHRSFCRFWGSFFCLVFPIHL